MLTDVPAVYVNSVLAAYVHLLPRHLLHGSILTVICRLNYRDTVRHTTGSLRPGKAINLSTSVRTGPRGGASSTDWASANVSQPTLPAGVSLES